MPGLFELIIIGFISIFFTVIPFWMICSKAGFPGWISLAVLIPVLNIVLLFFLAFAKWPALRHLPQQERTQL
ncbi:hypothetical protein [Gimesia aquarii]|uniref:Uncharacterized protein n=1 Tax=Gimesia aquarii TaxID=2527964 RepID=A0A517WSK3_9PLAN|nr:hypothetical protein [Gimesia aquarii]QDU08235.1 hypothetical protein V202x_16000 [Gimesia aquarii]